jgi:hypothetical protein
MAIAFQNATTAVVGGAANGNITINVPASTADGDFLITGFAYEQSASPSDPFMSAAWNQITEFTGNPTHDLYVGVWWRRASSEPASYTVTTNGTYGDSSAAFMLRYTGVKSTGDPIRVSATSFSTTDPVAGPALAGLQSTDLAVQLAGVNYANWTGAGNITMAGPGGGWTQRANQMNDTSDSKTGIAVIDQINQGTGPTWTVSSETSAVGKVMLGFGLIEETAASMSARSYLNTQQAIRRTSLW